MHDRLSRTVGLEVSLVRSAVNHVQLSAVDDERILAWGGSLWFKASAVYRMIKLSGHELPLHDLNWDGFMPVKVKVFAWLYGMVTLVRGTSFIGSASSSMTTAPFAPGGLRQSCTYSSSAPAYNQCGRTSSAATVCPSFAVWKTFGVPSPPVTLPGVVRFSARRCVVSFGLSGRPGTGWCSITSGFWILTCGTRSRSTSACGWSGPPPA